MSSPLRIVQALRNMIVTHPLGSALLVLMYFGVASMGVGAGRSKVEVLLALLILTFPHLIYISDKIRCAYYNAARGWPRQFGWATSINLIAGLAILLSVDTKLDRFDTEIISATLLIALTLSLPTIITQLFSFFAIARFCKRRNRPSNQDLAERLYAIATLLGTIICVISFIVSLITDASDIKRLLLQVLFAIGSATAFGHRATLWNIDDVKGYKAWLRFLPHLPATQWVALLGVGVLIEDWSNTDTVPQAFYAVFIFNTVIGWIGTAYWATQRFKHDVVRPLENTTESSDSILANATHYVDAHQFSDELTNNIQRASNGVLGVTGSRGVGKSALAKHVLHAVKPHHFTMSIAAPARLNENMEFLTSLCRDICTQVMKDFSPILYGSTDPTKIALVKNGRNFLVVILLMVMAAIAFVQFAGQAFQQNSVIDKIKKLDAHALVKDPLFDERISVERVFPLTIERETMDQLLAHIKRALAAKQQEHNVTRYLLVPNPGTGLFFLHRQYESNGSHSSQTQAAIELIESYLEDEGWNPEEAIHPFDFFAQRYSEYSGYPFDIEEWNELIAMDIEKLASHDISFPLISNELTFFLNASKSMAPSDTPLEQVMPHPSYFLSTIILKAFTGKESRLAFDHSQLAKLGGVIKIYRALLDGKSVEDSKLAEEISGVKPLDILLKSDRAGLITLWVLAVIVLLVILVIPIWFRIIYYTRTVVNRRYLAAYTEAKTFHELLTFQSSQERSQGFGWQGLSIGRSYSLSRRELTLAGLTTRYLQFIQLLIPLYNGKLVIAIDELDKIQDPEQLEALLTEIKGALFAQGVFYLITLSEEAARPFRLRLASGRDMFESTFDNILDIPPMDMDFAVAMLSKMEDSDKRLPEPCLKVAALFGGGIPREVVRAWRKLSYKMQDCTSDSQVNAAWAVWVLLHEELSLWDSQLGESHLTGTSTVELKRHSMQALACMSGGSEQTDYEQCFQAIQACIAIVDPEALRKSVAYVVDRSTLSRDEHYQQYHTLMEDLQGVFRLLILMQLGIFVTHQEGLSQAYVTCILQCHRAVVDKPALAESLLENIRREMNRH